MMVQSNPLVAQVRRPRPCEVACFRSSGDENLAGPPWFWSRSTGFYSTYQFICSAWRTSSWDNTVWVMALTPLGSGEILAGLSLPPPWEHAVPQSNINDSTDPADPWGTHLGFRNSFFLWIM